MTRPFTKKPKSDSNLTHLSLPIHVTSLTHDGRGIATYDERFEEKSGKKVFVNFALPDETVTVKLTKSKKHHDEAEVLDIITKSPHRVTPICPHFGVCGGCTLQHLDADEQIKHKQSILQHQLAKANLTPLSWLPPLVLDTEHYRTKARLGVRYLPKSDRLILGFRERASNFLTDIDVCPILDVRVSNHLKELKAALHQLQHKDAITHVQIAMGEPFTDPAPLHPPSVALILRHVKPLSCDDQTTLINFGKSLHWQIYLQPKDERSIHRIDSQAVHELPNSHTTPPMGGLFYTLPEFGLRLESSPTDFTQVNLSINRHMVALACRLLALKTGERVLDLFCGLGNFSLAIAKCVGESGQVIGVEGSPEMVMRARMNAHANGMDHAHFFVQDLTQDFSKAPWVGQVDALLIDPPRTGAWEVMNYVGRFHAKRIVYVSCDVATLVRDSVRLAEQGYELTHVGVMDMFCHTGHVESIARFEKIKKPTNDKS